MDETLESTSLYTLGYSEEVLQFSLAVNTQEKAGYLWSHLTPGIRLLDIGCGPGAMAACMAAAVSPGDVYVVDIEPTQVERAKSLAAERGVGNVIGRVGDFRDLPFDDEYFDVVHCNEVLAYIPEIEAALAEAKRVLKPGGILGCREIILDAHFIYPSSEDLARAWEIYGDLVIADDGHPQMGASLGEHLNQAGFIDIRRSASFDTYSGPKEVGMLVDLMGAWFFSQDVASAATNYGAGTADLFMRIGKAVEEWRAHPAAFTGFGFGEALAVAP